MINGSQDIRVQIFKISGGNVDNLAIKRCCLHNFFLLLNLVNQMS